MINPPSRQQEQAVIAQWKRAADTLAQVRAKELQTRPYDWKQVDALLALGCRFRRVKPERCLVAMQRLLKKLPRPS